MLNFAIRRCIQAVVVLLGITVVVFMILQLKDPAALMLPEDATEQDRLDLRRQLGLDDPLLVQYTRFLRGAVLFDFGISYRQQQPAMKLVFDRLPATVELSLVSFLIAIVIALPAGVISAHRRGTVWDHGSMVTALLGQSMPNFWLGLIFILVIALRLDLLPTSGRLTSGMEGHARTSFFLFEGIVTLNGTLLKDALSHIVLPSLTAGLYATARLTRMVRSGMLEVLGEDYVRTARSKGLVERIVIYRHALKNAAIPVVTLAGMELGLLLGGTVVTETVFSWPGVGLLSIEALQNDDFPVVQAAVFFLAFIFIFINMLVDMLYAWLDPKIRLN